jgi:phosphoribosyl 1,2-cyclic phosphodiesterase
MIVKFWGVRGSVPTPLDAKQLKEKIVWALKGASDRDIMDERAAEDYVERLPHHIKGTYGGNTPCVELHSGDTTIIFDAGSGIRLLGLHLMDGGFGQGTGTAHLFLSHVPGNKLIVYSPHSDIEKRLAMQQAPSYFPVPFEAMQADIEFVSLSEGENLSISHIDVTNIKLNHPGGSFCYRVKKQGASFVYATDTEFINLSKSDMEKYIGFFSQAKVLVFDSQYSLMEALEKENWGHSSSLAGVEMAYDAGVETLVLFHHEPTYDDNTLWDILQRTRKYAELKGLHQTCKVIMAYEGLELVV